MRAERGNGRPTSFLLAALAPALLASAGCGSETGSATSAGRPATDASAQGRDDVSGARREGHAEINGTRIYYERLGSGAPVMVVHGGPMLDHGYLLPHLAPLADDYELVFADQRLSGRSAGTVAPESVRLATFVDDIEALRRELGLGPVHLLAHSWGGLLATRYALRYPESLRSLVLSSPMAPSSELWQREQQAVGERLTSEDTEAIAALRSSEAFAERRPEAIEEMLTLTFATQFHDRARVADLALYVPDDYVERSRQFGALQPELASYDLRDRLGEITVPTLILYGDDEPAAALGGEALARGIPGARLETVAGSGHFPFIERPEELLRVTSRFLAEVDAAR